MGRPADTPLVLQGPGTTVTVEPGPWASRAYLEDAFAGMLAADAPPTRDAAYRMTDRGVGHYPSRWLLERDGVFVNDARTREQLVDVLLSELDELVIHRNVATALCVHAGAVEVDGRAWVVPGRSGAGKTTLTASLLATGAGHLTDEVVVVDRATTAVTPYARPLCAKEGGWPVVRDLLGPDGPLPPQEGVWHVRPTRLGRLSPGAAGVAAVVVPERVEGAPVTLEPLPRAEAALRLAQNASLLAQQGPEMLDVLARTVRDADCVLARYGDAREAAAALREALA